MKTCNICSHKFVCRFEYAVLGDIEKTTAGIYRTAESHNLTKTEIRHILAEHCQYFKSIQE